MFLPRVGALGRVPNGGAGNLQPSLNLNMMTTNAVGGLSDPRVSFTRASSATYFDSTGTLRTSPYNLYINSGPLTSTTTTSSTRTTDTTITAPDGSITASRVTEDSTASTDHAIDIGITPAGSTIYCFSVYLRAGTRRYGAVEFRSGANWTTGNTIVQADLQNGVITNVGTAPSSGIQNVGGGWYRVWLNATSIAAPGAATFRLGLSIDGTNVSYNGDGASYGYFWGAQVEVVSSIGTGPSVFVATGASASGGPRFDNDPVAHTPLGLLIEESRTNIAFPSVSNTSTWTQTNATLAVNQATAPDGTNTASLLTDNSTNAAHNTGCNATFAFVSSTTYAFSIYAKAGTASGLQIWFASGAFTNAFCNFDLNAGVVGTNSGATLTAIQNVGNGWYRCIITLAATGSATVTTFVVGLNGNNSSATRSPTYIGTGQNIYLWGAQTETGAFPTSYIPTTAATVTRSADVATMPTGAWWTTQLGTLATEANIPQLESKALELAGFHLGAGTKTSLNVNVGNSITMFDTAGLNVALGAQPTTPFKAAFAYQNGTQRGCLNAGTVQTGALATMTAGETTLGIGCDTSALQINGWIRRIRYWPRVLSNAELQQATT